MEIDTTVTESSMIDSAVTPPPVGNHDHDDDHDHGVQWLELTRIGFVLIAVALSWLSFWQPFEEFDVVALAATLIGGYPIFREAIQALLARRMTMELSMTIALIAALAGTAKLASSNSPLQVQRAILPFTTISI
jgi:cation transport ATPase